MYEYRLGEVDVSKHIAISTLWTPDTIDKHDLVPNMFMSI